MAPNKEPRRLIAQNRRARYDYHIEENFEAGIILTGSEVKSLRQGKISINEAHAGEMEGAIYLFNANISEYSGANRFNHEPKRPRKLLLHKKQINKLIGQVKLKGYTLIPLSIYFNEKNLAKLDLGLAKGKKNYDKRETEKEREWDRRKARVMKDTD
jgi:SsrA-binding protein